LEFLEIFLPKKAGREFLYLLSPPPPTVERRTDGR
jgi:hypothetical protein